MCPTNLLTFQAFIHEHSRDYCYIIEHILAEKQSDFLTCKLGSSKYMSNSVYKFRYPDANMSAPTCVRKYYRSETDVKTQYFHICKDLTSISGGQILHMKESHGGIFGQCRWTGLGLVSVNGLSCQDRCT